MNTPTPPSSRFSFAWFVHFYMPVISSVGFLFYYYLILDSATEVVFAIPIGLLLGTLIMTYLRIRKPDTVERIKWDGVTLYLHFIDPLGRTSIQTFQPQTATPYEIETRSFGPSYIVLRNEYGTRKFRLLKTKNGVVES